jgi:hypothetical protein
MLALLSALGLSACSTTAEQDTGPKRLSGKPRIELVNRLAPGEQPRDLAVYSYSRDCERNRGALSKQADLRLGEMCRTFSERIAQAAEGRAAILEMLPNGEQRTPLHQSGGGTGPAAQYRLVLNVYPAVYPGGTRPNYPTENMVPRRPTQGALIVKALLYRSSDTRLLREVEYTRLLHGYSTAPALFVELAQQVADDVVRDFFPG